MADKTYIRRSKHDKENPYMMLRRETAQNKGLSYEALGLLTYLLSKPDNWQVKIGDLQRPKLCGRDKARSLLEELVEKGYAKRDEQGRNAVTGQFEYGDYEVAEMPIFLEPLTENPYTVNPSTVEPHTANPTLHSNELDKVEKKENKVPKPNGNGKPHFAEIDMNAMKEAIRLAFGWEAPNGNEWGQIQRAAYDLLASPVSLEDVRPLYRFCREKYTIVKPTTLAGNVSEWRKQHKKSSTPAPEPAPYDGDDAVTIPDDFYEGTFK